MCEKWQNQYPVLFMSLKRVEALNFEETYDLLVSVIAEAYKNHIYLMENERIHSLDKEFFYKIATGNGSLADIKGSLFKLIQMMAQL